LLLPGLDGTGELFAPFVKLLPASDQVHVARFAPDAVDYAPILDQLELPSGDFTVVAESFSGPLGVMLAARCQRVRGLALAASFVSNPSKLTFLAPLLCAAPTLNLPAPLLRHFMLGDDASSDECKALAAVFRRVSRASVAGRLASVRRADVKGLLGRLAVPVLLLRPQNDRLIAARVFDELGVPTKVIAQAPHLVLQRAPAPCLAALREFFSEARA
jgi:pimeloyl-ACP methyl ester carboxylesterase